MDNAITYCQSCNATIAADADTCSECGAAQHGDGRPGAGMATPAPPGWQAGRPAASPSGFTVEEP